MWIWKPPVLRCFICFQGCHDCEQVTALLLNPTLLILSGSMWLCKSCHESNNTVKTKEDISRGHSSKSSSRQPPSSTTPASAQRPAISTVELEQQPQEILRQQNKDSEATQLPENQSEEPNQSDVATTDICEVFKEDKCPHGFGGKKLIEDHTSSKSHTNSCRKSVRNGTLRKWGCRKGDSCNRYHPVHCTSSTANKTCHDVNWTCLDFVGTQRKKADQNGNTSNRNSNAKNASR